MRAVMNFGSPSKHLSPAFSQLFSELGVGIVLGGHSGRVTAGASGWEYQETKRPGRLVVMLTGPGLCRRKRRRYAHTSHRLIRGY